MAVCEVLTTPHPLLRQICAPVTDVMAAEVQQVIHDLRDTCEASGHSVGIAANQIGRLLRVVYINCSKHAPKGLGPQVLINPEIISREDSYQMREGCMSLPEYVGPVPRSRRIIVRALDEHGELRELKAAKFEAVVIQHEIDHLDGILFTDRMISLKTDLVKRMELLRKSESEE